MTIIQGDCLEVLKTYPDNHFTSIITDPPYGLSFMGKKWDYDVPSIDIWKECLRVLKPGGTMLCFAGSRTQHRMTVNIEDAGFLIKDCLMWLYGSGFPKSTDISKQLDKIAGVERKIIGERLTGTIGRPTSDGTKPSLSNPNHGSGNQIIDVTAPSTPEAKQWDGYKSHGLKPAYEIVICGEKPFTSSDQRNIIVENLLKLEAQLWLILSAKTAEKYIGKERNEQKLANIAQWNASEYINIRESLLELMDMFQLEETVKTILNTVILWKKSLEDLWKDTNMSTIKTVINQIIDLKTLSYFLSENTLQHIIKEEIKQRGSWLNASPVAKIMNAVLKSMNATQELSVAENVISSHLTKPQGVAGKTLSPNYEPIIMAMKPNDGTYANNALKWGVSGLNIDAGRIETEDNTERPNGESVNCYGKLNYEKYSGGHPQGRFPANIILDEEAGQMLGDKARFFYTAKASKAERNGSTHPTVKPLKLMEYLIKLIMPPTNGLILDPFAGSGTTIVAATRLGYNSIGIELEEEYCNIAIKRVEYERNKTKQMEMEL